MNAKIIFTKKAQKQFCKLDKNIQKRIDLAITKKLQTNPTKYLEPLDGNLTDYYKFRVGTYRLVCKKESEGFLILVVYVMHRKQIYDRINQLLFS